MPNFYENVNFCGWLDFCQEIEALCLNPTAAEILFGALNGIRLPRRSSSQ